MKKENKMADENVLNIDGKGYAEADLNNQQKYLIAQLKDLSVKASKLRADLDQVQRAADSFQKELLESFKNKVEEKESEKAS
tara:strand:- start:341 stop:586 length:246 start_codon:yes stop_codon:yes gene_type:complete